ncbi:5130_t:CDS:2, partial [Cetraspora pellucida]
VEILRNAQGHPNIITFYGVAKGSLLPKFYVFSLFECWTLLHRPKYMGATLNATGFNQQQIAFNEVTDFCKEWIEVSDYKCPLEPGNYIHIVSEHIMTTPNDLKNTTIDFDLRVE